MSSAFDDLLEVQAHDTRLDQIRHLLAHLPEQATRDTAHQALVDLDASIATESATRDDLARQQRRLDDEIETINQKRKSVEATLYGGTVTNARELQDLQEESGALARRVSQLEDQDLEIMEQIEPIDARLVSLTAARGVAATALDDAEGRLTVASAELAAALDVETAARSAVAAKVEAALLKEYDQLRAGNGGVGVARLVGSQCGGCHLTLSAVEVAGIRKHPDVATHCEECGRLLVP